MKTKWPTFELLQGLGMQLSLYNYCWMMATDGYPPEVVQRYLQGCDDVSCHRRPVTDAEIEKAVRDAYSDALSPSAKSNSSPSKDTQPESCDADPWRGATAHFLDHAGHGRFTCYSTNEYLDYLRFDVYEDLTDRGDSINLKMNNLAEQIKRSTSCFDTVLECCERAFQKADYRRDRGLMIEFERIILEMLKCIEDVEGFLCNDIEGSLQEGQQRYDTLAAIGLEAQMSYPASPRDSKGEPKS